MSLSSNIRAGAAYVEVTANNSKLRQTLSDSQARLKVFGDACTKVGKDLLLAAGAAAVPMAMAVKQFAAFDDQMRLVRAVTQATEGDFIALTKTAQKLGRETSWTAQQVAEGMTGLGRMGFSPDEIQKSIQPVMNLARSTGTDLASAADFAANSLRIFGLEAGKMASVTDVLTATANGSAQTLSDLFEGLKMAGPQAKAAKENITDVSAALGVLANMGIKGSLAGTALRKSYSRMARTKVQDQLKSMGVEVLKANGDLKKMSDIMYDISKAMSGMASAEKIAFAEEIFDIRGSLAGLTLTGNIKQLDEFMAKLSDIDGVAQHTSDAMDEGLGGSFRLLLSAVEGAMNAFAAAINGTLQSFVDKVTAVVNVMTVWIEENKSLVTTMAATVAGVAALGVTLVAIGVAAKSAAAGITAVKATMTAFSFVQGVIIGQGSTLGTMFGHLSSSIRLAAGGYEKIGLAANQLLMALNLPIDVRANRIAAGLIYMSNAETAAAGRSIIAAKWQAACAALKSMSAATVGATLATKAHTAATALAAVGTKALTVARATGAAVTALFSAANLKAAASAVAGGAANLFLALTTKAVAAGYLVASAAAAAFCAIPISWILIAIGAALAGLVIALSRAGNYTAKLSEKMTELREKGDELRKTDKLRMQRLQQLAEKQSLTNREMAEAKKLAGDLQKKYGDLGISVSDNAQRISVLSSAVNKLGDLELRVKNADDLDKIRNLKALSMKVELSVEEQNDAAGMIEDLSVRYGELGVEVDRASGKIIALNDAATRIKAVQLSVSEPDVKLDRLKELSLKVNLTVPEQNEAQRLILGLEKQYGELGLAVDRATGRIVKLNSAVGAVQDLHLVVEDDDLEKLGKLKALSLEAELNIEQKGDAETLIDDLSRKYGDLGIAVDQASGKIVTMNAIATRLKSVELQVSGEENLAKFNRLKELSLKVNLVPGETAEAETLIGDLSRQYGDVGLTVDKVTGKVVKLNSTIGQFRELDLKIKAPEDLKQFDRLKDLARLPKLESPMQVEAGQIIADLSKKYGQLSVAVDHANGRIVAVSDVQRQFAQAVQTIQTGNDPLKETHLAQLERLQKLAEQEKLTSAEQAEAQGIVEALNGSYGSLGLGIDTITGKLNMATDAQGKLNDVMKAATISELDAEIAELDANIKELNKENSALTSYWKHNLFSQISGSSEDAANKIEVNSDRIAAAMKKISALKQRKTAVEQGSEDAVTGEGDDLESNVNGESERREVTDKEADKAAKRMADIDKKLIRERQTELQNEIDDIRELAEEYKELIKTMLDYEQAKPEEEQDKGKIADLQGKLDQADKTAEDRIKKAQDKAQQELDKEAAEIQKRFDDNEADAQRRREDKAVDREIDKTIKSDPEAGIQMLNDLINQAREAAIIAKDEFQRELDAAKADGTIDDDERQRLNGLQQEYQRAESLLDKYEGKLYDAQEGTNKAVEDKTFGSFFSEALNAMLGGGGNEAERTANATEQMARHGRETNKLLKKLDGSGGLNYS